MEYDYIIVGAGAAGCVLAYRLSEDPSVKVLLLEYGGRDVNPLHYVPKGFFFTLQEERYLYHYPTRPFKKDGTGEVWTRGRVSGGSTTVNGMMYTRGFAADYDGLVERGNPGWGWDEMLRAFKAMEDHELGASAMRGGSGRYGVSTPKSDEPVSNAIIESARKLGWKVVEDANEEEVERIGFTPSSVRHGKRVSAASAFLEPARRRSNLTVMEETRAIVLLFDGTRVKGVRAVHQGNVRDYHARREVISSGGTIESTLLLERSGVGNPEILRKAGVDVVVESPNVGERVIEQRGVAMQVVLKEPIGLTQRLNSFPKQMWEGFKYLLTRKGPVATAGYDLICGIKSSPDVERPDIQGLFVPMALDATSFDAVKLARHSGIMFMGYQIHPTSQGSVHLSGASPDDPPVIEPNYLQTDLDRKVTSTILEHGRAVFAQQPVADLVAKEEYPGEAVSTREQTLDYALNSGATIYHAVGACAMGPGDDDVVDPRLRVRGVSGLRVVDASVLPAQPSGNTAGPTMAVGWRAADLILEDR